MTSSNTYAQQKNDKTIFNTPPALAAAIGQPGWRACSTAATHTLDQGQRGVDATIRALDRAGVAHTGSYSSAAARRTPRRHRVRGLPAVAARRLLTVLGGGGP